MVCDICGNIILFSSSTLLKILGKKVKIGSLLLITLKFITTLFEMKLLSLTIYA